MKNSLLKVSFYPVVTLVEHPNIPTEVHTQNIYKGLSNPTRIPPGDPNPIFTGIFPVISIWFPSKVLIPVIAPITLRKFLREVRDIFLNNTFRKSWMIYRYLISLIIINSIKQTRKCSKTCS